MPPPHRLGAAACRRRDRLLPFDRLEGAALRVLARKKWVEVEQTVAELRIRLGERARKLNEFTVDRSQGRVRPGKRAG